MPRALAGIDLIKVCSLAPVLKFPRTRGDRPSWAGVKPASLEKGESMGEEKETTDEDGNTLIERRLPSNGAIEEWLEKKVKEGYTVRTKDARDGVYLGIVIKKKDAD